MTWPNSQSFAPHFFGMPPATTLTRRFTQPFTWLWGSLFWRTFVLIALLLGISMGVWFQSLRVVERGPRAQQIATQVVSIVKLTRAALTYSDPVYRRQLLQDLVNNEGIKVYPREKGDAVAPVDAERQLALAIHKEIRRQLGQDTQISPSVNQQAGFWVSFQLEGDDYWVVINRERLERYSNQQLFWWSLVALGLALLGAAFISAFVNRPLQRLAQAARAVGAGEIIEPLPEPNQGEVAQANRSFNQMVHDLAQLEADRALMLAGISHDLRTPLARLRLETELSPADPATQAAMNADISQMDSIINQFLDYAKPSQGDLETIDLSHLLAEHLHQLHSTVTNAVLTQDIAPECWVNGNRTDLQRVLNNLFENAQRYGKTPADGVLRLHVEARRHGNLVVINLTDQGSGVPESALHQLTRPFFRFDAARSDAKGAGLGLAIVQRLVQRMGGQLTLRNQVAPATGLHIQLTLPAAPTP